MKSQILFSENCHLGREAAVWEVFGAYPCPGIEARITGYLVKLQGGEDAQVGGAG
jgi:hypothetical protein